LNKTRKSDKACIEYVQLGIWPFFIGFTTQEKKFTAGLKRKNIEQVAPFLGPNSAGRTHRFTQNDEVNMIIICIKPHSKRDRPVRVPSVIAHEAVHALQDIKAYLGLGNKEYEAEAYTVELIVRQCLEWYDKGL